MQRSLNVSELQQYTISRRRPRSLLPLAAGLRLSFVRARRLHPALACPIAHVSHAAGQIHNPIIIYISGPIKFRYCALV